MRACGLSFALFAAEENALRGLTRVEGDDRLGRGDHTAQLRKLARQQAVHGASDAPLQEAEARRVLELLLQPTQPVRGPAYETLRLTARHVSRWIRLLLRPLL